MKTPQNKLSSYLAITTSLACTSAANSSTIVFSNGPLADSNITTAYNNDFLPNFFYPAAAPANRGLSVLNNLPYGFAYVAGDVAGNYFFNASESTTAVGVGGNSLGFDLIYFSGGSFISGAEQGSDNFSLVDLNNDGIFESVLQFEFTDDSNESGDVIAIASNGAIDSTTSEFITGGDTLSLADGISAIQAAAIPEPSSLTLLALGAAGLAARRQRKKAS